MDGGDWVARAHEALSRTSIMVLATVDPDSGSWTSPVQFSAGDDFTLSFQSRPGTRHGLNIERNASVALSIYSWPGPDGGNLGLQITGLAAPDGPPTGGWQRYVVQPIEVWCFDSRVDHERHRVAHKQMRATTKQRSST